MGMPCMNCRKEVPENQGAFFLQVFLCQPCNETAVALRERARSELENVFAVFDHTFREELVRPDKDNDLLRMPVEDVPKLDLGDIMLFILKSYLRTIGEEKCQSSTHKTPSSGNTQLPVAGRGATALSVSSRPKAAG